MENNTPGGYAIMQFWIGAFYNISIDKNVVPGFYNYYNNIS